MLDQTNLSDENRFFLKEHQKLRTEIDQLRLESQLMREKLSQYKDFSYFIGAAVQALYLEIQRLFYKNKRKIGNLKRNFLKNNKYHELDSRYSRDFQPYKVCICLPVEKSRKKVLHFLGNFNTGGSSQLVVDLVEHLGHQFEQEVIVKLKPKLPDYMGIIVHEYPNIVNGSEIFTHLKKYQPDLIHVHYWGGGDWDWYHYVFEAAKEYGCKIVENVNIPVVPYFSNSINTFVYVSNYVRNNFSFVNGDNLTIYPGSNLNVFSRKINIDTPENCIGMAYRLDGDKLDNCAIDVFIKVVQRRNETKVLIIGGGSHLEMYEQAVHQAGVSNAFTFTGIVAYERLPELYEQMSIFVAPVYKESFGQVTPFAMNMKIPVVGYQAGAIEEIIENSNLLASPGDSDALAEIIVRLLNDRKAQLDIGKFNHERAQTLFSVEVMIEAYKMLYEKLLST